MTRRNDDDEEIFSFKDMLKTITTIAEKVSQNPRGAGLLSVVLGLALKKLPRHMRLTESFKNEGWIQDSMKEKGWDENQFCRMDPRAKIKVSGFAIQPICEIEPEDAVDLVPINSLFGIPINSDFGKVPISDFLIVMGGFGVANGFDFVLDMVKGIKP